MVWNSRRNSEKNARQLKKVLSEESESRTQHGHAVVVQHLFWFRIQSCQGKKKGSSDATKQQQQQRVKVPSETPTRVHTDNSPEFIRACEDSGWNRGISTPNRSETIGKAERVDRRVKEETASSWCNLVSQKDGGTVQWNATAA